MPHHIKPESMKHMELMKEKLLEQANAQKRLQEGFDALKAENKQLKDQLGLQAGTESSVLPFLERISRLERQLEELKSTAHFSRDEAAKSLRESWASNQKIQRLDSQLSGINEQVKMTPTSGFFFGILADLFQILCMNLCPWQLKHIFLLFIIMK